jgi:hypothetical protein
MEVKSKVDLANILLIVSVGAYAVSWFLPALIFRGTQGNFETEVWEGWQCVYMSMLGLAILQFEGLANLLYIISVILLFEQVTNLGCLLSGLGVLLSLQTLTLFATPLSFDEGHTTQSILVGFDAGFYLWIAALCLVFLTAAGKLLSGKFSTKN